MPNSTTSDAMLGGGQLVCGLSIEVKTACHSSAEPHTKLCMCFSIGNAEVLGSDTASPKIPSLDFVPNMGTGKGRMDKMQLPPMYQVRNVFLLCPAVRFGRLHEQT